MVRLEWLRRIARSLPIQGSPTTVGDVLDHEYTEGPVCLILRGTVKLPIPVPCRGKLGLWDVPKYLLDSLREAIKEIAS